MKHELLELTYGKDELQPFLSEEAVEIHYEKHHRGYVDKLNQGIEEDEQYLEMSLEEIIKKAPPNGDIFNNAAQIWNHSFFWRSVAPQSERKPAPTGILFETIVEQFGNTSNLLDSFVDHAADQFGSGWAWLVKDKESNLTVVTTANAETVIREQLVPLLVCDVWEHAYYIDYRNDRGGYLKNFIKAIDWQFAEKNFT